MTKFKRFTACLLAATLCVSLFVPADAEAAKKPKLAKKKLTLAVKATKKIKIKNVKAKKVKKLVVKSNKKKIATAKKSGKTAIKVTGKKAGKANITVKVTLKGKKKPVTLKLKVTVKNVVKPTPSDSPVTQTPTQTSTPTSGTQTTPATSTEPTSSAQPSASAEPSAIPTITPAGSTFTPVTLVNTDFENNSTDGFTGRVNEKLTIQEDGYNNSGNCLQVTNRSDTWHGATIDLTKKVEAGATYSVTGYMYLLGTEAYTIKCSAATGSDYPAIAEVADAPANTWTKLEGTVTVPQGFSDFSVYFEVPGSKTADFLLDCVTITQISEAVEPVQLTSIKDTYSDIFDYMGMCLNYNHYKYGEQLTNTSIMKFVNHHFNSFSLENEMKPDAVLGNSVTKISVAKAKEKGYIIPDNYTEDYVPQLNFTTLDKVLEVAHENNIKMRAHTLMWHQQTPSWFFSENYANSKATDVATMDARLEFYVRTVMEHIMAKEYELTKEYGSLVYAWDVTNEYIHRSNGPSTPFSWVSVYEDMGLEPTYVKKAYQIAYEILKEKGVEDKVTLFYNDYDTYFNVDKVISLVNYINEGETDSEGNPVNICGGIGMQSHVDVDRPTIKEYKTALERFLATGLEIQLTELDMTINWNHTSTYTYENENQTHEDQAAFVKALMEMIISTHKNRNTAENPKGITGITIWGLSDSVSWRGAAQSGGNSEPLLFGDSIFDPKPSFNAFIEAATTWNQ